VVLLAAMPLALLVAAHSWRGARLSRLVQQELASLPGAVTQSPHQESEPLEVVEARKLLGDHLEWIGERAETADKTWFGAPYLLTPDHAEELEHGVAERALFFEGLDQLPDTLWSVNGTARDPIPRIGQQFAMTGALTARAWLAVQEDGGSHRAGRDLARVLAIARVTDNGQGFSLAVRCGTEYRLLSVVDRILQQPLVDRDALLQPIKVEIERAISQDRYRLMLDCDVRYLLAVKSELVADASPWRLWLAKPGLMIERLAFFDTYRELRSGRPEDLLPLRVSELKDPVMRIAGTAEPAWMNWRSMARIELQRREELATRLSSF
jgi:hypothetical protein